METRPGLRCHSLALLLCSLLLVTPAAWSSGGGASLSASTVSVASGTLANLSISLSGSAGPAALQWTLIYDSSAIPQLSIDPGPALAGAGKTLVCAGMPGNYNCLAYGLNNTPIPDGPVATLNLTPSISAGTVAIGLTLPVAASPAADSLPISAVSGAVTVYAMPSLTSLVCALSSITTPGASDCTVTLSGPAPPGGAAPAVTSSSGNLSVPSTVAVPAGSTAASFTATASSVPASQSATITVAFNGASMSAGLSLTPPVPPVVPVSLACMPSSLAPGGSANCTVILSGLAPPAGSVVTLLSANPALVAPSSVMVPAGSTSATFTASAGAVASTQPAAVTASSAGGSAAVSLSLNPAAGAPALSVGPGQTYSLPCQALTAAPDGATVQIDAAGVYSGDVCTITANNLTVKGMNGRPLINAIGTSSGGPAVWVFQGDNITLDTVEVTGAANSTNNAAGVFFGGNNPAVLNSYFRDNQAGLVTAAKPNSQVVVQASEFNRNGFGDGQTHNIDIGPAARLTLQYSYSHNANAGDLAKSAASENYILYNRLTSETGTSGTELELPGGGRSFLVGNLIEKGAADLGGDLVAYLLGGTASTNSSTEFYAVNNTMVSDKNAGVNFLDIGSADATPAVVTNNIFYGAGTVSTQAGSLLANNLTGNPLFVNQAAYDYHLSAGSPAIDSGSTPSPADGVSLVPAYEYLDPACGEIRNSVGSIDIGAYEFSGAGAPLSCAAAVSGLTLSPATVTGGASSSGTITVTLPAFSNGTAVALASSNPGVAAVPASVSVPSGSTSASFSISTSLVAASTAVTISASYSGGSQSAVLTVLAPPALSALQCTPASLASSASTTCTVALVAAAPAGGVAVNLASGGSLLTVPTTVAIPAGSTSATFTATAGTIVSNQSVSITAMLNGSSQSTSVALAGLPGAPASPSPGAGAAAVTTPTVLSWAAGANTASYDVYFGTSPSPSLVTSVTAASYAPASLAASTTYYWKVIANGPGGSASSPVWSFTTAAPPPAPGVPGSVSASPSSGAGLSQTFTFTYSDSAGYPSLKGVYALITVGGANANACWISYDPAAKLVWLSSDNTSSWSSTGAGSAGSVQNSECQVSGTGVRATGSGNTLSVTFPVTFAASFAGAKTIYLYAVDTGASVSSYAPLGSWTVAAPPSAPANPAPAAASVGVSTTPALSWAASSNATSYSVYFGSTAPPSLVGTVSGTAYQPAALAASTTYYWKIIANGLGGSTASSVWSFTTAAPAPAVGVAGSVSALPSSGSGLSQTFTFTYTDSAGYSSLKGVYALITLNGANANACWMAYDPEAKLVWLANDSTSAWSSTGPGGTVQNNQCQIMGSGVSAFPSGNTLSVTFPLTFSTSFAGTKTIYLYAVDVSGSVSPYVALGSWTVP